MPKITTLPFDYRTVSLSVERDKVRSDGVHLTHITKDMLVTAGITRKSRTPFTDEQQHLLFQQGFLWERMVADYIATPENKQIEWDRFASNHIRVQTDLDAQENASLVRPGECQMDGIWMTPDAINTTHWHLEEWKATGMRADGFNIEMRRPEWLWQAAAYCRFYKMTRGIFRIYHYGSMPPSVTQLVVDWEGDEIEQNWKSILQHYHYMCERDGLNYGQHK